MNPTKPKKPKSTTEHRLGTRLFVRYEDRERVKALGARWDPHAREWYAPHGTDLSMLAEFIRGVRVPKKIKKALK